MDQQKCPSCAAPMIVIDNRDGSYFYKCEYCGNRLDIRAQTVSSRIFALANRVADALNEKPLPEQAKQKKSLSEKMDEIERAAKAFDQRRRRFADKLDKWGF